jgi:fructuronate reductase
MQRLTSQIISDIPPTVRRPHYDRAALQIGLAHIGVGAFHRCHQAEYIDDMLEARFGPWGLVGINLFPPRLSDLLIPQDCLYSRTLREGDHAETRVIGSIKRAIDVQDVMSAEAAIAALAAPAVQVVTMTVTEKGYCLIPASGALDRDNAALEADLGGAFPPRTLLGLLTRALERRRATGGAGLTLVSCDNIPRNGARLRKALLAFAAVRSPDLARWIESRVAFPSTMVDRIVPATASADIEAASASLGARDEAAVVGEPFRQWVIEDVFAGERPPWDLAGAQFTPDTKPYEQIKMRILNAAQSTLSHQGALVGHQFSFEAAEDPILSALIQRMLERETASTLPKVSGMEVGRYIETSLTRIRNRAIRHTCHQIGTDGSQKIVQRLVDPLRERLAAGQSADLLTLSISSWMAYCLAGSPRFGRRWIPSDPWAQRVIAIGDESADFDDAATAILSIAAIFGVDLVRPDVTSAAAKHLRGLLEGDARGYLMARLSNQRAA